MARLPEDERILGGRYVMGGVNVTGQTFVSAELGILPARAIFRVCTTVVEPGRVGRIVRVNLIRKSTGWKWLTDGLEAYQTLISVETGSKHFYATSVFFETPVTLQHYPDKVSEPRLRPTTRGFVIGGPEVGQMSMRGRHHPVYDQIRIAATP
jgi:hypothetical protein